MIKITTNLLKHSREDFFKRIKLNRKLTQKTNCIEKSLKIFLLKLFQVLVRFFSLLRQTSSYFQRCEIFLSCTKINNSLYISFQSVINTQILTISQIIIFQSMFVYFECSPLLVTNVKKEIQIFFLQAFIAVVVTFIIYLLNILSFIMKYI